jgi:hypothetical protein
VSVHGMSIPRTHAGFLSALKSDLLFLRKALECVLSVYGNSEDRLTVSRKSVRAAILSESIRGFHRRRV